MEFQLEGRVALVTGASRGIGKAIAMALAEGGAEVIACARHTKPPYSVFVKGGHIYPYTTDVMDLIQIKKLLEFSIGLNGRLDILVNNVGGAEKFGDFFSLTDEDWERAWRLNFMSMVYFCREAIPWLRKSDCARIINIAALNAHQPGFFNPHYVAAKAAMLGLNKYLANFLARDNILVNAICPSTLKGGGWERNVQDRAARDKISLQEAEKIMEEEENKKTPLGRIGTPEDVAKLVVFLCSGANNYITGSVIDVDGGIRRSVR